MRKAILILAVIFGVIGCDQSRQREVTDSISARDSLSFYLSLANSDTLRTSIRLSYNAKALKILRGQSNDSTNRSGLFKVANRYYNIGQFNQYKDVSAEVLYRSLESKDTMSLAKAYIYFGDFYKQFSVRDSALFYYVKAEKLYSILRRPTDLATVKINKASIFWEENDYFESEASALEALKYLREVDDPHKKYEALILLGIISNAKKDYLSALEYLNKALEIAETEDLPIISPLATTLNNIGNVHQSSNNNLAAISHFKRALQDANLRRENPLLYAVLLDNLAYSTFKLNAASRDIEKLFIQSLSIKDSLNYLSGIAFTKTRLAEFYHSSGNKSLSIKLSEEALLAANLSKNAINKLAPLKQLSSYDVQNSKRYSEEYIKINDSVQQAERRIKDKFARIQFETDEISLQKDKLAEQNRNLLLFFVGTVMIGLLLFVIRTQRAKNRELMLKQAQQKANEDIYSLMLSQQNKIEEGRIKEKKRIAQELHDGVLSRLFGARLNLDSLNKMDGDDAMEKRNNYLTELKNIEQDIREISHDLNREKFVLINNFLAILNNLLEEQASNFEPEVETNIDDDIPWDKIGNTLKINLYRIVQEALQNINKYAKATKITVSLSLEGNNLRLRIADNGQGFAVDRKSKGIGLQNILSRAQECDGQLDLKSKKGKGTTISVAFPTENKTDPQPPQASTQPAIA